MLTDDNECISKILRVTLSVSLNRTSHNPDSTSPHIRHSLLGTLLAHIQPQAWVHISIVLQSKTAKAKNSSELFWIRKSDSAADSET